LSNIAIKVESLTKEFQIGQERSGDFRESFGNTLKTMLGNRGNKETFTALNNISFEVEKGQALGIIGRNGAGKSTLLKILSRISEPTRGRIEINGRVSSLLEVGTGFHPELTGRENVYLNGTILGMKRREVKSKFDKIIDFSGVEKFVDTPIKHYSSGMKVRLAFSVAAHLDPEILLIDEVLAVGDAEFQKKCLGKMENITGRGRTVLFVSHNMNAINHLCTHCIYLKEGKLDLFGETNSVISVYLKSNNIYQASLNEFELNKNLKIEKFMLDKSEYYPFESINVDFELSFSQENLIRGISLLYYNDKGQRIAISDLRDLGKIPINPVKKINFKFGVDDFAALSGEISIGVYVDSELIKGDFLDLISFVMKPSRKSFTQYDRQHLGVFETKTVRKN